YSNTISTSSSLRIQCWKKYIRKSEMKLIKKDKRYLNNDICRFIKAQENDYQQALSEITLGRKKAIGCGIFSLNSLGLVMAKLLSSLLLRA
ncbi:MAG: hypothetical protein LC134_05750, partial [Chitinophagales bacterium]|nr:hypothetical protein [Chitinophagales bacterium]